MPDRNETGTGQEVFRSIPPNPEMNTLTEARQVYQNLLDAQMKLRISEEKYRTLVEHQNDLVVKVNAKGLFLYASPSYCRTFGISEEELIGKSFVPMIHPDDVQSTQKAMEELYKPPHTCYVEQRAKTTDGWRWLAWSDQAVMNEKGEIDYIIGVGRDVTDRRMVEEKVLKNEEQFKSILELLPEMVVVHQNGTIVFANRMATSLSGYSQEEMIGKDMLSFVADKDREMVITNFERRMRGEYVAEYELELKAKADTRLNTIIRGSEIVFNGKRATLLAMADITRLKKTAALLSESETRYRSLFHENQSMMMLIHPISGKIVDANPAACSFYGYNREEMTGLNIADLHAASPDELREELEKSMKENITNFFYQHTLRDGTKKFVEAFSGPINFGGEVLIYAIVHDITDRVIAEDNLHERMKELNCIYELSKLLDTKGITTEEFLKKSLSIVAEGFKYPTNTVVSITIRDQTASHPNFVMTPWSLSSDIKVNSEAAGKITVCLLEKREEDSSPFFREEKQLIEEIAYKIGRHFERREGMNALIVAKEKAEAGDRLKTAFIQNISHEVRTPLNGIMGFSSLLGQSDLEEEDKQQFISLLKLSSERLLGTITDYMDISMLSSGNMEPHWSQVKVKQEMTDLYEYFLPWFRNKNIPFRLQYPEGFSDLWFESDRTLFRKAVQHVIGNALKFTHQGSVIVQVEVLKDQFDIVVTDTGIGVAEEALSRIFKLFEQEEQTRTRRYEGSGLGLPITWGILDLLGGKIHLDSVKGKGTTVRISFPFDCKEERLGDEALFSTGTMKLPVILIVEDDLGNRFLLEKILADSSSRLLQAADGLEAVEVCRKNPDIDIVLMDLRMPGQDGITTMLQIRKIYPNLPVIAVTAYALSVEADRIMEAGCNDIISKPIQKKELIDKIKQVLG